MKKSILLTATLAALATFSAAAQAAPPVGTATKININWTPGSPTAQWPACSSTVKTTCIQGTSGTVTSPAGGAAIPLTIASGVTTNSAVYSPGGPLYLGAWVVTIWTAALDQLGNQVPVCTGSPSPSCTQAISTTVVYSVAPTITAPAPGGITVQFQ